MTSGKIYVLSSTIFKENIYKVGRSRNFTNRLKSYKTAYGLQPTIHYEKDVIYDMLIEKLIHIKLKKYRYSENGIFTREHYQMNLQDLITNINEIIDYVGNECDNDVEEYDDDVEIEEEEEDTSFEVFSTDKKKKTNLKKI